VPIRSHVHTFFVLKTCRHADNTPTKGGPPRSSLRLWTAVPTPAHGAVHAPVVFDHPVIKRSPIGGPSVGVDPCDLMSRMALKGARCHVPGPTCFGQVPRDKCLVRLSGATCPCFRQVPRDKCLVPLKNVCGPAPDQTHFPSPLVTVGTWRRCTSHRAFRTRTRHAAAGMGTHGLHFVDGSRLGIIFLRCPGLLVGVYP
jgi:hypothetical protein